MGSLAAYDRSDIGLVLAASSDGYLWALDRSDGRLVYRTRLPPGPMSRITVRDDIAVMTADDGTSGTR